MLSGVLSAGLLWQISAPGSVSTALIAFGSGLEIALSPLRWRCNMSDQLEVGRELPENDYDDHRDEEQILNDQDMTNEGDITKLDEIMGAKSGSLDVLEDEESDFMRGEVDVKAQMDRAERALDQAIHHHEPLESLEEDETPGGLEEVILKTDQDLAKSRHTQP